MTRHRHIRVFTISPRTREVDDYWRDICKVAQLSEQSGLTGVLLFAGNDTYLEPWVVAQDVLNRTRAISPLVAVNPVYLHPFTLAKTIASLVRLYTRKIYLNMITGTALSYQRAMGDTLTHDERYDRLREYIEIVQLLLGSTRPVTFNGTHYRTEQLQLFPGLPAPYAPEFLLSGQSAAARRVCAATGATGLQMLPPALDSGLADVSGMHFGIVSRETRAAAWQAARALFPENAENRSLLQLSMANTDAEWKHRMQASSAHNAGAKDGFWLQPFANFHADCPYLVGEHAFVARTLEKLVQKGIDTFVFDVPAREEEFLHLSRVLHLSGICTSG